MRPAHPALSSNYNYLALCIIRITGINEHIQLHSFFIFEEEGNKSLRKKVKNKRKSCVFQTTLK